MRWNENEGYVKYNSSMTTIQNILGIGSIDIYLRPELSPYYTYIFSYLCSRLVMLGPGYDIKTYIQEVFDTFSEGAEKIIFGAARDLAFEIGINDSDVYIPNEEIPYCHDRFVFSWTNAMTTLCQLLKLTYSGLFVQETEDCPCACGGKRVNTCKDNEEWSSGVFPEDENYDWSSGIGTGWSTSGNYFDQCTRCNRTIQNG